jgi:excisionase family DNA binding protein
MERIADIDLVHGHEGTWEPLLDAEEAAKHLGVHPKTLQKMARAGKVPCFRIGRHVKFRLSALDVWVRGSENRVSQPFA